MDDEIRITCKIERVLVSATGSRVILSIEGGLAEIELLTLVGKPVIAVFRGQQQELFPDKKVKKEENVKLPCDSCNQKACEGQRTFVCASEDGGYFCKSYKEVKKGVGR